MKRAEPRILGLKDLLIPIYEKASVKWLELKATKYKKLGNMLQVIYESVEKIKNTEIEIEKIKKLLERYLKQKKSIEVIIEEEKQPYRVRFELTKILKVDNNKIKVSYQETERDPIIFF